MFAIPRWRNAAQTDDRQHDTGLVPAGRRWLADSRDTPYEPVPYKGVLGVHTCTVSRIRLGYLPRNAFFTG